jgi:hypothetical protein
MPSVAPQHDPPNLGAGWQPGDLLSQERQFVEDCREATAVLVGLEEGETAAGIVNVKGSACIAAGRFDVTNSGNNGSNASSPTGHASGGGASPTRSPGLPVRQSARHQRGLG